MLLSLSVSTKADHSWTRLWFPLERPFLPPFPLALLQNRSLFCKAGTALLQTALRSTAKPMPLYCNSTIHMGARKRLLNPLLRRKIQIFQTECSCWPDLGLHQQLSWVSSNVSRIRLRVSVNGLRNDFSCLMLGRPRHASISAAQIPLICSSCSPPRLANVGSKIFQRSSNHLSAITHDSSLARGAASPLPTSHPHAHPNHPRSRTTSPCRAISTSHSTHHHSVSPPHTSGDSSF